MPQEDENNSTDMTEKIEIFSTDDEKIKSFGELLTNDSSRSILQLLFKEEMTANEIAQKTKNDSSYYGEFFCCHVFYYVNFAYSV